MPAPESVSPSPKRHAAIPSVQGEDRQTPPTKPQHHAHHHPPQSHRRVPLLLVPQARRLGLWGPPPRASDPLTIAEPPRPEDPKPRGPKRQCGRHQESHSFSPLPCPPGPLPLPTASCGIWDSRALTRANTTSPNRWCLESRQADTQAKNSAEASPRAPRLPSQREHPTPNARLRVACTDCCRSCVFISGLLQKAAAAALQPSTSWRRQRMRNCRISDKGGLGVSEALPLGSTIPGGEVCVAAVCVRPTAVGPVLCVLCVLSRMPVATI